MTSTPHVTGLSSPQPLQQGYLEVTLELKEFIGNVSATQHFLSTSSSASSAPSSPSHSSSSTSPGFAYQCVVQKRPLPLPSFSRSVRFPDGVSPSSSKGVVLLRTPFTPFCTSFRLSKVLSSSSIQSSPSSPHAAAVLERRNEGAAMEEGSEMGRTTIPTSRRPTPLPLTALSSPFPPLTSREVVVPRLQKEILPLCSSSPLQFTMASTGEELCCFIYAAPLSYSFSLEKGALGGEKNEETREKKGEERGRAPRSGSHRATPRVSSSPSGEAGHSAPRTDRPLLFATGSLSPSSLLGYPPKTITMRMTHPSLPPLPASKNGAITLEMQNGSVVMGTLCLRIHVCEHASGTPSSPPHESVWITEEKEKVAIKGEEVAVLSTSSMHEDIEKEQNHVETPATPLEPLEHLTDTPVAVFPIRSSSSSSSSSSCSSFPLSSSSSSVSSSRSNRNAAPTTPHARYQEDPRYTAEKRQTLACEVHKSRKNTSPPMHPKEGTVLPPYSSSGVSSLDMPPLPRPLPPALHRPPRERLGFVLESVKVPPVGVEVVQHHTQRGLSSTVSSSTASLYTSVSSYSEIGSAFLAAATTGSCLSSSYGMERIYRDTHHAPPPLHLGSSYQVQVRHRSFIDETAPVTCQHPRRLGFQHYTMEFTLGRRKACIGNMEADASWKHEATAEWRGRRKRRTTHSQGGEGHQPPYSAASSSYEGEHAIRLVLYEERQRIASLALYPSQFHVDTGCCKAFVIPFHFRGGPEGWNGGGAGGYYYARAEGRGRMNWIYAELHLQVYRYQKQRLARGPAYSVPSRRCTTTRATPAWSRERGQRYQHRQTRPRGSLPPYQGDPLRYQRRERNTQQGEDLHAETAKENIRHSSRRRRHGEEGGNEMALVSPLHRQDFLLAPLGEASRFPPDNDVQRNTYRYTSHDTSHAALVPPMRTTDGVSVEERQGKRNEEAWTEVAEGGHHKTYHRHPHARRTEGGEENGDANRVEVACRDKQKKDQGCSPLSSPLQTGGGGGSSNLPSRTPTAYHSGRSSFSTAASCDVSPSSPESSFPRVLLGGRHGLVTTLSGRGIHDAHGRGTTSEARSPGQWDRKSPLSRVRHLAPSPEPPSPDHRRGITASSSPRGVDDGRQEGSLHASPARKVEEHMRAVPVRLPSASPMRRSEQRSLRSSSDSPPTKRVGSRATSSRSVGKCFCGHALGPPPPPPPTFPSTLSGLHPTVSAVMNAGVLFTRWPETEEEKREREEREKKLSWEKKKKEAEEEMQRRRRNHDDDILTQFSGKPQDPPIPSAAHSSSCSAGSSPLSSRETLPTSSHGTPLHGEEETTTAPPASRLGSLPPPQVEHHQARSFSSLSPAITSFGPSRLMEGEKMSEVPSAVWQDTTSTSHHRLPPPLPQASPRPAPSSSSVLVMPSPSSFHEERKGAAPRTPTSPTTVSKDDTRSISPTCSHFPRTPPRFGRATSPPLLGTATMVQQTPTPWAQAAGTPLAVLPPALHTVPEAYQATAMTPPPSAALFSDGNNGSSPALSYGFSGLPSTLTISTWKTGDGVLSSDDRRTVSSFLPHGRLSLLDSLEASHSSPNAQGKSEGEASRRRPVRKRTPMERGISTYTPERLRSPSTSSLRDRLSSSHSSPHPAVSSPLGIAQPTTPPAASPFSSLVSSAVVGLRSRNPSPHRFLIPPRTGGADGGKHTPRMREHATHDSSPTTFSCADAVPTVDPKKTAGEDKRGDAAFPPPRPSEEAEGHHPSPVLQKRYGKAMTYTALMPSSSHKWRDTTPTPSSLSRTSSLVFSSALTPQASTTTPSSLNAIKGEAAESSPFPTTSSAFPTAPSLPAPEQCTAPSSSQRRGELMAEENDPVTVDEWHATHAEKPLEPFQPYMPLPKGAAASSRRIQKVHPTVVEGRWDEKQRDLRESTLQRRATPTPTRSVTCPSYRTSMPSDMMSPRSPTATTQPGTPNEEAWMTRVKEEEGLQRRYTQDTVQGTVSDRRSGADAVGIWTRMGPTAGLVTPASRQWPPPAGPSRHVHIDPVMASLSSSWKGPSHPPPLSKAVKTESYTPSSLPDGKSQGEGSRDVPEADTTRIIAEGEPHTTPTGGSPINSSTTRSLISISSMNNNSHLMDASTSTGNSLVGLEKEWANWVKKTHEQKKSIS